jgi:23S rRNA (cytidine1920-2'-O)/16S rRNA (cytidine1409-2'-O)-methyltransferase
MKYVFLVTSLQEQYTLWTNMNLSQKVLRCYRFSHLTPRLEYVAFLNDLKYCVIMRLDKYLVEQKFFSSRARAKEAIEKGDISVSGVVVRSPDQEVQDGAEITVTQGFPWVSRGALKLEYALEQWGIDPKDLTILDLGASTGGFTEVLLSRGAKMVYAVDVGHGQLHQKIASDSRVVGMEGVDARSLKAEDFDAQFPLIVGDLSFISLSKILPTIDSLLSSSGEAVLLIKPQFEVGFGGTKKGVVKDESKRKEVVERIDSEARALGFSVLATVESPVIGGSGNIEYLIHIKKQA